MTTQNDAETESPDAAIDNAMVLAAGLGRRMKPLTDATPKPLLVCGERSLLDRTLDRVEEVGVRRAVVNVHHHADQVTQQLATRISPSIAVSDEREQLMETGGGVVQALPQLGADAFLTVNSDTIWIGPRALAPLVSAWRPALMDGLLLVAPVETARGYSRAGDFFLATSAADQPGPLTRRGDAAQAPYVYTGAQLIKKSAFDGAPLEPFSLNRIWDEMLAAGRLYGVGHFGGWIDVGTVEGLEIADRAVRSWPRLSPEDAGAS